MTGLIPLLLPSSTGGKPSPAPIEMGRRASLAPLPSPPISLIHRRQQSLPSVGSSRRNSFTPPATLPIIPFTSVEWKNAIDEVKRKYLNRKYRACSARCCEVLDNLKNPSAVEPIYLIYLHFYAASSFELCARPLSCSSSYRTMLLRDAQAHYHKAEALIQSTEDKMTCRTRSDSSSSSNSSLHSPGLSSTTLSSPRTSVCSAEDGAVPKGRRKPVVKAKKKVSFSGLNDLIEFQPEPYIRPDSPTLGWEDDIYPQHMEDSFPLLPMTKSKPERLSRTEVATALQAAPESPLDITKFPMPGNHQLPNESSTTDDKFSLDAFLQARSMNRLAAQLSALRSQVTWHRDGIEALLAVPDDTPETPALPMAISPAAPKPLLVSPRQTRANTMPTELELESPASERASPWTAPSTRNSFIFDDCSPRTVTRPLSVSSTASTVRCSDEALQQRIQRLRAGGWQRKRFDSRRYEALREQVLIELGA